ncbi:conserved hypothetical protein [Chloroherpeton thalassium ATCC 35110]|uniref:Protoporphyrinogen IX oxidase n=1 Tax=Chloroherpeton thalassium (strain ATCC 35110 / GB-78) TaxID=517418 RepID=B3QSH5_CHLT3|nr:hypothetical protein [Chloroherpeton thalassium]ACF12566.1 conserved hypothetical protein [Chloroherpeton thalassium ATCC 35110]
MYQVLLFLHVASFAIWMGIVVASLMLIKSMQPKLTDFEAKEIPEFVKVLKSYIGWEVKIVDVMFLTVIITGALLAHFYIGWNTWTITKGILVFFQLFATIGYVFVAVRKLEYPCKPSEFKKWYTLFTISLSFFTAMLLFVFFGR